MVNDIKVIKWCCLVWQVAIPVVPTVRVVITFTKFVDLQPTEQFYTPLSSPRHLHSGGGRSNSDEEQQTDTHYTSFLSSSSSSGWLRRNSSQAGRVSKQQQLQQQQQQKQPKQQSGAEQLDPFAIPTGYTWMSIDEKTHKMKKSKSIRKSK